MFDRILAALIGVLAAGTAAAFFLYASLVYILVIAGGIFAMLCAASLLLVNGKLDRWVEIEDVHGHVHEHHRHAA